MYFVDFGETFVPSTLTFQVGGPKRLCTKVDIVDDEEIESFADESFFAALIPAPFERVSVQSSLSLARVLITDNEGTELLKILLLLCYCCCSNGCCLCFCGFCCCVFVVC